MNPFGVHTSLLIFIYLLIDFNYFCNLFCISYLFLWQLSAQIVVCDITEFGKKNSGKQHWRSIIALLHLFWIHKSRFRHADKTIRKRTQLSRYITFCIFSSLPNTLLSSNLCSTA
jgi:hypothetical protein